MIMEQLTFKSSLDSQLLAKNHYISSVLACRRIIAFADKEAIKVPACCWRICKLISEVGYIDGIQSSAEFFCSN